MKFAVFAIIVTLQQKQGDEPRIGKIYSYMMRIIPVIIFITG